MSFICQAIQVRQNLRLPERVSEAVVSEVEDGAIQNLFLRQNKGFQIRKRISMKSDNRMM